MQLIWEVTDNTYLQGLQAAKDQTNLRIHVGWSAPLLFLILSENLKKGFVALRPISQLSHVCS